MSSVRGPQEGVRRYVRRIAGGCVLALLAVTTYILYYGEVITLRATGAAPIHPGSNTPVVVRVLSRGDRLDVIGCEDTKSDLLVKVRLGVKFVGYVGDGEYVLERRRAHVREFVTRPGRIVLSCAGMFMSRAKE